MTGHGLMRPFWTTGRIDTALSLLGAVVACGLALRFGLPLPWLLIAAGFVLAVGIGYALARQRFVGLYLRVKNHRADLLDRVRHAQQPLPESDLTVPLAQVLPPVTRAEVFEETTVASRPDPTKLADATAPIALPKAYADTLIPAAPQGSPAAIPPEYAEVLQRGELEVADPVPTRRFTVREMRPGDRFRYVASTLEISHIAWPPELEHLDMALVAVDGLGAISLTLPAAMRWQMVRAVRHASVRCLVCSEVVEDTAYDLALVAPVVVGICDDCDKATSGEAA